MSHLQLSVIRELTRDIHSVQSAAACHVKYRLSTSCTHRAMTFISCYCPLSCIVPWLCLVHTECGLPHHMSEVL